jgi:phospholipid/cholesterol/gamma-HCH transport system substrate-binding protein
MISKEIKVGLLAIAGLVVGYFGFNYLKGNSLFNKGNTFYAVYEDVEGLHVGSKVMVNGFPVGKVKDISVIYSQNNKLLAEFVVVDESVEIPSNTVAQILSMDVFGSKVINLVIGDGATLSVSGDTLISQENSGMLDDVQKKIEPYERKVNNVLADVDTVMTGIKQTIDALNEMLTDERKNVSEIVQHVESVTANLEKNNANITNTLSNVSAFSDSLSMLEIKQSLDNMNLAIADLAEVMEKLNSDTGTFGKLLTDSSLYVNLNQTTVDLDLLIKDLNENPGDYVHFSLWGKKDKEKSGETEKK